MNFEVGNIYFNITNHMYYRCYKVLDGLVYFYYGDNLDIDNSNKSKWRINNNQFILLTKTQQYLYQD